MSTLTECFIRLSMVTLATVVAAGSVPSSLLAQQAAGVASPADYHGYALGTRYTLTHAVDAYYRALASSSPRVVYEEYGHTIQGRPLPMVIVGSETNIAGLDAVRGAVRRIAGADGPVPAQELERLVAETPAVVWIFIVDTDEEAGVEVLQEVAWELATADDAATRAIRDRLITIFTPLTNPDSHARYVTWHQIYDVDGAATDPLAIENRAHWAMNTDGNAWGVDVNRDFGWFVTPEMQALARAVMAWRPQLMLDVHSGPNTIFLPPFPRPYHPLWDERAEDWWIAVATRANDRFGRLGWSFKSRIDYEGVAGVGFGLSWGMLGPAVASFLFETFGGRPAKTTAFVRDDATVATLRMAMDRHKAGIYSLLEIAHERHDALLREAHDRVSRAMDEARNGEVRTIIVPAGAEGTDPHKLARLIDRLLLQEIAVRRATEPFRADVRDFLSLDRVTSREFPAGTFVIDLVQPNARLARALLDPTIDFSDPVVELPYRRDMPYYDAPWENLPLLFGVPAFATVAAPPPSEPSTTAPAPAGIVDALDRPEPAYAWVWPAGRESSLRLGIALIREGYRIRVFQQSFRVSGEDFTKGAFTALRIRNPATLDSRIRELAVAHGAHIVAVAGPFTEAGATFGDDANVPAVPPPLVAVLADWPVNHDHTYGGIRSTLEGDFGMAFSPVMLSTINTADLSKYTAVVLPHAGMDVRGGPNFSAGYRGLLHTENLRRYVTGGGTLVAVQGAASVVAEDSILGRDVEAFGWAEQTEGIALATWVSHDATAGRRLPWTPGLGEVGPPLLAAGYGRDEFAAPASFPVLLSVRDGGAANVIARYADDANRLALDGFIPPADRERLAGRPFVVVQRVGRGRVILFAEDPTFRGAWYGMNTLFLNALLLGPTM